jgi:hypothetical protein
MDKTPHEFEDDLRIVQTIEDGQIFFCAYSNEALFRKYPTDRAGNAKVAMQLAVVALSQVKLNEDIYDIAVWFNETYRDLRGRFSINRYRYQRHRKLISHIIVFSAANVRSDIETVVAEAFVALGWQIDSKGSSSVEWLDAPDISDVSAHHRLKAFGRVQRAVEAYRRTGKT